MSVLALSNLYKILQEFYEFNKAKILHDVWQEMLVYA